MYYFVTSYCPTLVASRSAYGTLAFNHFNHYFILAIEKRAHIQAHSTAQSAMMQASRFESVEIFEFHSNVCN